MVTQVLSYNRLSRTVNNLVLINGHYKQDELYLLPPKTYLLSLGGVPSCFGVNNSFYILTKWSGITIMTTAVYTDM